MDQRQLKLPDISKLDPDLVVVRYDEPSDTMFVHFYGTGKPGVAVQVDENLFVRLDEDEESAIGLQIEAFFHSALLKHPEFLSLVNLSDVPSNLLRDWLKRDDSQAATLDLISSMVHDLTGGRPTE